jgi:hypothetical protein
MLASAKDPKDRQTTQEQMAERNTWDGFCSVCGAQVRALEGIVEASDGGRRYRILCAEHVPAGSLDAPKPPEVSRLPSIHMGDERYER